VKKLPIFKLTIKQDDPNTGVDYVALVDDPAIKVNWQAFNEAKQLFQVANDEKRIISGPLMIADMPIYRRSTVPGMEEYYAVFTADTINQISQKYFRENKGQSVNLMHEPDEKVNGVYCIESFIIDSNRGINTPKGFDKLPDGSWFGSFKVDNEKVWQDVKAGIFKGFSVEGFFDMSPQNSPEEETMLKVIDILEQMNQ
jgi:hypothetical protein